MVKRNDFRERRSELLASLGVLVVQLGGVLIPEASDIANGQTFAESQSQQLDPSHGVIVSLSGALCLQVGGPPHDRMRPCAVEHL